MSEILAKHLLFVRHGESEGDKRRAMKSQPLSHDLVKHPRDEEETELGQEQSLAAGKWVTKHVLDAYGIKTFDWQLTSPLIRTRQSAQSMNLSGEWAKEERLTERDRGSIQGMTQQQHKTMYPDSYRMMKEHPFLWVPVDGESLLQSSHFVTELIEEFIESSASTAICMTHRDRMWSTYIPIEHLNLDEIEQVNTDAIQNAQIFHITNVNPESGHVDGPELTWKRSVTPWSNMASEQAANWSKLSTGR